MSPVSTQSLREISPRDLKGIVREIPTLPIIYQKLFQMMQDPDVAIAQLAELITKDQALTAKLLRLVNSASYGYSKKIETINQALVIIGFRAVRSAALALSIFDQFKDERSTEKCDLDEFWEHSIAVASICKVLASHTKLKQTEEAFTVGLLHDIGKLIIKSYFPQDFEDLCNHLIMLPKPWYAGEKQIFQVDHATIGKSIFHAWNFPIGVVEAIQLHHQPCTGASQPQLAALVSVANYLAYQIELGSPLSESPESCDAESLKILGISLEEALGLQDAFLEETRQGLEILEFLE